MINRCNPIPLELQIRPCFFARHAPKGSRTSASSPGVCWQNLGTSLSTPGSFTTQRVRSTSDSPRCLSQDPDHLPPPAVPKHPRFACLGTTTGLHIGPRFLGSFFSPEPGDTFHPRDIFRVAMIHSTPDSSLARSGGSGGGCPKRRCLAPKRFRHGGRGG